MMPTELTIIGPAFLAGLLVLATHVPLGRQVIRRGIIFLDLAIAQIAGLAVLTAQVFGWGHALQPWIAYAAAVIGALLLYLCERRWGDVQEALIGVAFILAATGGMLVIAGSPQGGEHLHSLLAGQILWTEYEQLSALAALSALVLALWFSLGRRTGSWLFYLLFALSVTASVQLVGVYLVFASLIIPALAVRGRHGLGIGYLIGAIGYGAGLLTSMVTDLPAGPVIVWCLAVAGLLWGLFTSRK